jgi:hypothetical protein
MHGSDTTDGVCYVHLSSREKTLPTTFHHHHNTNKGYIDTQLQPDPMNRELYKLATKKKQKERIVSGFSFRRVMRKMAIVDGFKEIVDGPIRGAVSGKS